MGCKPSDAGSILPVYNAPLMRAAVIFGLGCPPRSLHPFQQDSATSWQIGLPASAGDCDAILLFGGDGTLHRHLASLVKLDLPVLIVPAGSGNDFARALHLKNPKDSLAAWRSFEAGAGNIRAIDLGKIIPLHSPALAHYFASIAGCGLDGAVARRANALPRWLRARGGYLLSLPAAVRTFQLQAMRLSVAADNGDFQFHSDDPAFLIAFANSPAYGDGMKVAPRARLDDGLLDVCRVGEVGKLNLLRLFPTVYMGRHLGIPQVTYFTARSLRLEADTPLDIYADGEFVCQTPVQVEIADCQWKVIVPAG